MLFLLLACDRGAPMVDALQVCETEPPPPALRLLTRREVDNTVRDLLGGGAACEDHADCVMEDESCTYGACRLDPCTTGTFLISDAGYSTVHLSGSFNGWPGTVTEGGWPLKRYGGVWLGKFQMSEGAHAYKLVVDESTWETDWEAEGFEDDGFGGQNSVVAVDCSADEELLAQPSRDLPTESPPSGFLFDTATNGLVSSSHLDAALDLGEVLAPHLDEDLESLAPRIWRRPLTGAELARYEGLEAEHGREVAVQALLASPHFWYRPELGDEQGRLTAYETASALSYFFWATMPDEELLQAAASGELDTLQGVDRQARRLLADPRSGEGLAAFAEQWLGIDGLPTATSELDAATRAALIEETGRFVAEVVASGGTYADLVASDWTVADSYVARHYGVEEPEDWSLVDLPGERAGVLGHGSVLAATSHSDQTSPVRRGLFVRERLLCQEYGTPPADAGGVPDVDPDATTRERFEQHSSDPVCASCHDTIDPVGFGFEHFGPTGAWRDDDEGHPIDASGVVVDLEDFGAGTEQPFGSLPELGALLARSERAPTCASDQLAAYAVGAEAGGCLAEGPVEDWMIRLVCSDTFLVRR